MPARLKGPRNPAYRRHTMGAICVPAKGSPGQMLAAAMTVLRSDWASERPPTTGSSSTRFSLTNADFQLWMLPCTGLCATPPSKKRGIIRRGSYDISAFVEVAALASPLLVAKT